MIRHKTRDPRSIMPSLVLAAAVAVALLGVMAGTSGAAPGDTTRVSVSSTGAQGKGGSHEPSISANGRFVAFASYATNLVPGDTNRQSDVFVHDRRTGTTKRVSLTNSGAQSTGGSHSPSVSANGRFVAFDILFDIFVHDRQTGTTQRVDVSSSGAKANRWSYIGSSSFLSANGRFVVFESRATNLVRGDTNRLGDVFVRDLRTGITKRVNVSSSGAQTTKRPSGSPSISDNGRLVAFESGARNLVPNDTNRRKDIFVHESRWPPRRSGS